MNDSFNIDRSPFVCSGAYLPFYKRPSRRYIVWYAPTLYHTGTLIPFHTNGSLSGEQRFVIREVSDWIQFISSKSIYANKSCDLRPPTCDQPTVLIDVISTSRRSMTEFYQSAWGIAKCQVFKGHALQNLYRGWLSSSTSYFSNKHRVHCFFANDVSSVNDMFPSCILKKSATLLDFKSEPSQSDSSNTF